jgi:DNA-binding NarL/FixJ family response regulator
MGPCVRIAALSDDKLFLEGILRFLVAEPSFTVVGHDESAAAPTPALRAARPDVVLVDSRPRTPLICAPLSGLTSGH